MKANNREEWHNNYIEELKDIYDIIIENMYTYYKDDTPVNLDTTSLFHVLSVMMYKKSSRYLSEYTKSNCVNLKIEDDYNKED